MSASRYAAAPSAGATGSPVPPPRTGPRSEIEVSPVLAGDVARDCRHGPYLALRDWPSRVGRRGYGRFDLSTTTISRSFRVLFR